jgi:hypothetical protein
MEKKNDLKERFEKRLHAIDTMLRLKPHKKSLSTAINEKVARKSI